MTDRKPAFIGLDIETTGLDPKVDNILEVGIVIFDDTLAPYACKSWLVAGSRNRSTKHMWAIEHLDAKVREMHTESGLLDDLAAGPKEMMEDVEAEAISYIRQFTDEPLPMLGSSVTFDRSFLAERMPDLLKAFHYRSVDATSVYLAVVHGDDEDFREQTEHLINARKKSVSDLFMATLNGDQSPKHRPIRDLCDSAALICASINTVYRAGAGEVAHE